MPTFVTLLQWTQKGIENVKEGPSRLDQAREALKAVGGEMKAYYLTLGDYDGVVISEVPSGKVYTQFILSVGSQGNVRTVTLRAFPEEEYRDIIASLP
jgi:uncharacterized protein with GYD domain